VEILYFLWHSVVELWAGSE